MKRVCHGERETSNSKLRSSRLNSSLLQNPPHRFLCQLVECLHAELQVLFPGIFDFVVADAMQALDKHHHCGHAGASDLGGVMQRTGWQTMYLATGFLYRVGAETNQVRMEKHGLDLPQTIPCDANIAFTGKPLAGLARVVQQSGKRRGVEMTLVKRYPAFLDDTGDDSRFRGAGADGANAAVANSDAIDLRAHPGGGQKSITSPIHGRAP